MLSLRVTIKVVICQMSHLALVFAQITACNATFYLLVWY